MGGSLPVMVCILEVAVSSTPPPIIILRDMRPVGPKRTHPKGWKEAGWCETSPHIDSLP